MLQYVNYLNLPAKVIVALAGLYLFTNVVGEILTFKGKVVPEFIAVRKYFARKRKEKKDAQAKMCEATQTLQEVQRLLSNVDAHYSADNIAMRDKWMNWVNNQAKVYDTSIAELEKKMDKNNEITLSLLIDHKRKTIIDFASFVIDEKNPVTREQFNRIFKLYEEYEGIIEANGMTNGEVDIAHRIISESYEHHMRDHSFIENIRGYDYHAHE